MAIITKAIKLETTKQNLIQAVIAKQNDCNSRFLKVTFLNEGTIIPLDSSSDVTINAERKDGTSKSFFGVVNDDDTATVPLHSWILELDGEVSCDISIIGSDSRLTTTGFVVKVEKAACSSSDVSEDPQYDVLANLLDDVNGAITKATYYKYDFNGDGVVDEEDAMHLQYYVNFPSTPEYKLSWWSTPDVNGDGAITIDDATTLLHWLKSGNEAAVAVVPKNELVDDNFNAVSNKPIQNKTITQGVANAFKGKVSSAKVVLKDGSPLPHEIKVKVSTEKTVVGELANPDNGSWSNEYNYGDYVVESIDYDYGDGRLWFTDGSYLTLDMALNIAVSEINIGDTIRFSYDEWDESFWYAYLVQGFSGDPTTVKVTVSGGIESIYLSGPSSGDVGGSCFENGETEFTVDRTEIDHSGYFYIYFTNGDDYWGRIDVSSDDIKPGDRAYISYSYDEAYGDDVPTLYLAKGEYKEPVDYSPKSDGTVSGIICDGTPITISNDKGALLEVEYNRDLNKVLTKLIEKIENM